LNNCFFLEVPAVAHRPFIYSTNSNAREQLEIDFPSQEAVITNPKLFVNSKKNKMSEPTTATSSAGDAPTREEENPEPLSFTLQVISTGPNSNPLSFPHLPATTTIKELKAKIRDALPTNPVDEHQRLIYRGRLLARETDTMLDIFGQETV
jgi:hypothetical protein